MDSKPLSINEYRALVEQAPILIWRARPDGLCDYFNERWLSFRGRTMEQEFGNGWAEGVHPDDFQRCLDIYLDNFHARRVFEMEYRLMRHDGEYRWIFDRGVPFHDEEGSFAGYIGSCIDVTERYEAQQALKAAQEAEIRHLKGLLPICMYCKKIKDDAGYWNQLEVYLSSHSDVDFSHGLCPNCAAEAFAELSAAQESAK
ncbi:PAS domain-containing protein [Geomesophilobacter sediminis]|uniref:histidine kinase n=1 Tax=Geomesophilobacter sediminis TaxID=2798584 RepID=A0A8J7J6R2_9BACT|nr:PAS domain-containing protein [Geomesophilobacter sediminis]MBJ6724556.1 PAS domain-containing protein [Geomesophilobacter sediminis]